MVHTYPDINIYTHTGPALFAFTLMMCALSLRTWRRNGVACDELLFLPGTEHGNSVDHHDRLGHGTSPNDGDAAVGSTALELVPVDASSSNNISSNNISAPRSPIRGPQQIRQSAGDDSISFVDSWDLDEAGHSDDNEDEEDADADDEEFDDEHDGDMTHLLSTASSQQIRRTASRRGGRARSDRQDRAEGGLGPVNRFRENHPRITRIGTFFFFRSSTTSTQNAAYAPSGPSVLGAALDMSMPVLFNFHLYIDAYNHIEAYGSEAPAKILPLIFLSVLIVRSFVPPGRRGHFWGTMKFTFMAPFHKVRFRDAFIGDLVTSLVRPLQDVLFALSYYVTVIYGTLSGKFGLSASATILEQSWLLHNVVLPSVALLPLWWRFLQTLRQCYDSGKRWPHLGNAVKYLSAALVVLYGMTHPEDRRSSWWLVSFALCLIYQVFWDVFVDWELIEIVPRTDDTIHSENSWFTSASSYRANSWFLSVRMQLCQPLHWILAKVPRWNQIQLRSRRLYKTESFYWKVLLYNTVFRFAWMLCYIPAYRLSVSGQEHVVTFSSDTNSYVGVLLPVAEILRRTVWGFLYLENKTIHMQEEDPNYAVVHRLSSRGSLPLEPVEEHSDPDASKNRHLPNWLGTPQHLPLTDGAPISFWQKLLASFEMSEDMRCKLFVVELSMWAMSFVCLGLWATT